MSAWSKSYKVCMAKKVEAPKHGGHNFSSSANTCVFFALFVRFNLVLSQGKVDIKLPAIILNVIKPWITNFNRAEAFLAPNNRHQQTSTLNFKPKSVLLVNLLLLCGDIN